jgi:ketosteroid isomerase-like protein
MEPGELHDRVAEAVNTANVDALLALYEPDARLVNDDGSVITERDAAREVVVGLLSLGGHMDITTRFVIEAGNIALLSNEWHFVADDIKMSGITAEVARRQQDGSWRYIVDNPYAVAVSDS